MLARHPLAELAPRDIVARGVFAEIAAGRGAFLDAREALGARFAEKFPTVYASCIAAGIDPATAADPGRARRALPHGRHRRGRARPHLAEGALGRRRSVLDRRAWRQPPRLELAAGGRGLCRAHRRGYRGSGDRRTCPPAGRAGRSRATAPCPPHAEKQAARDDERRMSA